MRMTLKQVRRGIFRKRTGRTAHPGNFEVFYAERAANGPTYRTYANSDGRLTGEGQIEWKATCPHGESHWPQSPGAFFCTGTLDSPDVFDAFGMEFHRILPIAFLSTPTRD